MERLQNFWFKFNNNMSLMSILALAIGLLLLAAGHRFFLELHSAELLYWYFGGGVGLMAIYAVCYGVVAENTTEFEGGLVRPRLVMPVLAFFSALSFLYHGFLAQSDPSLQSQDRFFLLAAGPAVMFVFAVTYCLYVGNVANDRLPVPTEASRKRRGGPARLTLSLLKWCSLLAIGACSVRLALQGDPYGLLVCIVELVVTFVICGAIEMIFAATVPVDADRGYAKQAA
jgi:hypothetical protein